MFEGMQYLNADETMIQARLPDGRLKIIEPTNAAMWETALDGTWGEIAPFVEQVEHNASMLARAKRAVIALQDQAVAPIMSMYSVIEPFSWALKEPAAVAYLAATATPDQIDMIEGEANLAGITPNDMATSILRKASEFREIQKVLSGLRKRVFIALEAASDQAAIDAILMQAESDFISQVDGLGF